MRLTAQRAANIYASGLGVTAYNRTESQQQTNCLDSSYVCTWTYVTPIRSCKIEEELKAFMFLSLPTIWRLSIVKNQYFEKYTDSSHRL